MQTYESLLDSGWTNVWTGTTPLLQSNGTGEGTEYILVKMAYRDLRVYLVVKVDVGYPEGNKIAYKLSSSQPGSNVGVYHTSVGEQAILRSASIMGVGPFMYPGTSLGIKHVRNYVPYVAGIDIEQTTFMVERGGFPRVSDPIICASVWTSRSEIALWYTCGSCTANLKRRYPTLVATTSEDSVALVSNVIDWLIEHQPDYVCIHNGYKFDVPRLAYHANASYRQYFRKVNLGARLHGYDICIMGVTVIDTMFMLNKMHRGDYPSMSLDSVSKSMGLGGKLQGSDCNVAPYYTETLDSLFEYNIVDSKLHMEVFLRSGLLEEISNLCSVFKSPIQDTSRFLSGTMCSNLMSSYALHKGMVMDWSEDNNTSRVQGGHVIDPIRGIHKEVTILDFASLYPSIMVSANISPDTVRVLESVREYPPYSSKHGSVSWVGGDVLCGISDTTVLVHGSPPGVATGLLQYLIRERSKVGKRTGMGWAYKVGANSLYGCLGYPNSKCYSYYSASCVTSIGRWLLSIVVFVVTCLNYDVVYGDTDSVFITRTESSKCNPDFVPVIVSMVLKYTPFKDIKLEVDRTYNRMIMLNPKMYCGSNISVVGKESSYELTNKLWKGIALARKDRPRVVKNALERCTDLVMLEGTVNNSLILKLSKMAHDVDYYVRSNECGLLQCSTEVRKYGVLCYRYRNNTGAMIDIEAESTWKEPDNIDKGWVLRMLSSSLDSVLVSCGIPKYDTLLLIFKRLVVSSLKI